MRDERKFGGYSIRDWTFRLLLTDGQPAPFGDKPARVARKAKALHRTQTARDNRL